MYFDFEDYRPTSRPSAARSRGAKASCSRSSSTCCVVIAHSALAAAVSRRAAGRSAALLAAQERAAASQPTFVFVAAAGRHRPRRSRRSARSLRSGSQAQRARARRSSRRIRCRSRAAIRRSASNARRTAAARAGRGPRRIPAPAASRHRASSPTLKAAGLASQPAVPTRRSRPRSKARTARSTAAGGSLGDALRNLQRYVAARAVRQPAGRRRPVRPAIQFDTKGVEFGPWIRRFIAQVKRNWFIPYAAMTMQGPRRHHVQRPQGRRDHRPRGRRPSSDRRVQQRRVRRAGGVESDRSRCRRSIPSDKAFFTVTFYYNEMPPQ